MKVLSKTACSTSSFNSCLTNALNKYSLYIPYLYIWLNTLNANSCLVLLFSFLFEVDELDSKKALIVFTFGFDGWKKNFGNPSSFLFLNKIILVHCPMKFLNKLIYLISYFSFIFDFSLSLIAIWSFLKSIFLLSIYISILNDSLRLNLINIFIYLFSSNCIILSLVVLFIK